MKINQSGGGVPNEYITIAHALGGYDNKTYTNSLEAFDYFYGLGQRFFEADITVTTDGFLSRLMTGRSLALTKNAQKWRNRV